MQTDPQTPATITLIEWANTHGIKRFTAAKWARQGRITATKSGRDWVVPADAPVPAAGQVGNPRWIANKGKAALRRELEGLQDEPANAW